MDKISIIQQGEMAKYKIIVTDPEYDLDTSDFTIELSWGLFGKKILIRKSDCTRSEDGNWYFTFSTEEMIGKVTAKFVIEVIDLDIASGVRQMVNRQVICFVAVTGCPQYLNCHCCVGENFVKYEYITDTNVMQEYEMLVSSDNQYFETSDNQILYVLRKKD